MKQLQDLMGWNGHEVLYFGDHPYSDLADVTLEHGWRTGAIINELAVSIHFIIIVTLEYSLICLRQYLIVCCSFFLFF